MEQTQRPIIDTSGAFKQIQMLINEMSGFADLLDLRQENMKSADFWLSEHLIRLIRQCDAINRAERPLADRELREATGRFLFVEEEPSVPNAEEI